MQTPISYIDNYNLFILIGQSKEKSTRNNQDEHHFMKLVNVPSESSLFQFISLDNTQFNQQSKYIKSDSYVQLRHVQSKTWVDLSQNNENQQTFKKKIKTVANLNSATDLNATQILDKNQIKINEVSSIRPFLSEVKNENQVFKLFSANESDVWEINFVISACKELTKLLKNHLIDKENPFNSIHISPSDFTRVKFMKKKLDRLIVTVKHLNEFCNNRMHNSSFDQKYGSINHYRQKLLREQYYIDILTQLLSTIFESQELEHLKNIDDTYNEMIEKRAQFRFKAAKQSRSNKVSYTSLIRPQDESRIKFNSIDYLKYIKQKRFLCISIYKLLTSICKQNQENEQYIFNLIPILQSHCKYVTQAIDCLISIISSNEGLLLKLSENLIIKNKQGSASNLLNFDRPGFNEIDVEQKIRGNKRKRTQLEQNQNIQANMLQTNLLNYFMDLIYDQDAPLKADYYRFLSSICRFKNDGISLNQENIYKLFKTMVPINLNSPNFVDKFKNGIEFPEGIKEFYLIQHNLNIQYQFSELYHQLTFLSDLSFGRNFQWLRELVKYFKFDYLLENIWKNIRTNSIISLSSCFSKLAMTLYIDHYPLYRIHRPNICRIFHDVLYFFQILIYFTQIIKLQNYRIYIIFYYQIFFFLFKNNRNIFPIFLFQINKKHYQIILKQTKKTKQVMIFKQDQLILYEGLLKNLINYLKDLSEKAESEFKNYEMRAKKNKEQKNLIRLDTETKILLAKEMGSQILNEDLLFQSVNMLNLLLDLDVFNIMNRQNDYQNLVQYLIKIFIYDRMNIVFCSTAYNNTKKNAEQRIEDKKNALLKKFVKIDVKMDDFNFFSGNTTYFNHIFIFWKNKNQMTIQKMRMKMRKKKI